VCRFLLGAEELSTISSAGGRPEAVLTSNGIAQLLRWSPVSAGGLSP
jgi:hypothetical protein